MTQVILMTAAVAVALGILLIIDIWTERRLREVRRRSRDLQRRVGWYIGDER